MQIILCSQNSYYYMRFTDCSTHTHPDVLLKYLGLMPGGFSVPPTPLQSAPGLVVTSLNGHAPELCYMESLSVVQVLNRIPSSFWKNRIFKVSYFCVCVNIQKIINFVCMHVPWCAFGRGEPMAAGVTALLLLCGLRSKSPCPLRHLTGPRGSLLLALNCYCASFHVQE